MYIYVVCVWVFACIWVHIVAVYLRAWVHACIGQRLSSGVFPQCLQLYWVRFSQLDPELTVANNLSRHLSSVHSCWYCMCSVIYTQQLHGCRESSSLCSKNFMHWKFFHALHAFLILLLDDSKETHIQVGNSLSLEMELTG